MKPSRYPTQDQLKRHAQHRRERRSDPRSGSTHCRNTDVSSAATGPQITLPAPCQLIMSARQERRSEALGAVLSVAYELNCTTLPNSCCLRAWSPHFARTLALVAEAYTARRAALTIRPFSFALGGKDSHPFPVPVKT